MDENGGSGNRGAEAEKVKLKLRSNQMRISKISNRRKERKKFIGVSSRARFFISHTHRIYIFGEYIFDEYFIKWHIRNGRRRTVHISVDFYVRSFFCFPLHSTVMACAHLFGAAKLNILQPFRRRHGRKKLNGPLMRWCAWIVLLTSDDGVRSRLLYLRVKCSSNSASNQFPRCLFILLICFVFTFFRTDLSVLSFFRECYIFSRYC